MTQPIDKETLEQIARLDDVIEYRVLFGGSEYGRYPTLEQAEIRMIALRQKNPHISGFYEVITELNERINSDPNELVSDLRAYIAALQAQLADRDALIVRQGEMLELVPKLIDAFKAVDDAVSDIRMKFPMFCDRDGTVRVELPLSVAQPFMKSSVSFCQKVVQAQGLIAALQINGTAKTAGDGEG